MGLSHEKGDTRESKRNRFNSIVSWIILIRPPFLLATAGSIAVGGAVAFSETGSFNWFLFALTIMSGVLIHMGTNAANDYFDHMSGNDDINVNYVKPFTGGSRMIQQGRLNPKDILSVSVSLLTIAALIGFYLFLSVGWIVLILGLFGAFSGFFYAAPPIRLASKGIGEILVGLNFGILLIIGTYYVQTESFGLQPLLVSIPIALSISAVLWINEFPDYQADKQVGKDTMVVRIGLRRASHVFVALILSVYILYAVFIISDSINHYSSFVFCTVPLGVVSVIEARNRYPFPETLAPANASAVLNHLVLLGLLISAYLAASIKAPTTMLILTGTVVLLICFALAAGCRRLEASK
ncbi:MAG: hypothetical protein GF309_00745 [Candidatus Lokiarchaeota archaeon]|nr:hypothetical protein [Candidatus Lokiarchaeota archaeon]